MDGLGDLISAWFLPMSCFLAADAMPNGFEQDSYRAAGWEGSLPVGLDGDFVVVGVEGAVAIHG
jgi:hypothetical protein